MKRAVWITLCLGISLGIPARLIASDSLVELALLFDATQLQDRGDRWRAAELGRDLVANLPPRVGVRAFRFGNGPDLVPLPLNLLTAESIGLVTIDPTKMTLQRALIAAEVRLCRPTGGEEASSKGIVLIGGSVGGETLSLSGSCEITVYAVSARSESDPPLRELAERTHGAYYTLARTKGYTISKTIRVENWMPSLLRRQRSERDNTKDLTLLWHQVSFLLLFAVLLVSLAAYLRRPLSGRSRGHTREISKPSIAQDCEPVPEAGLTICSESGIGNGIFWFRSREPVILGGKPHADWPLAHLVVDDPLVAVEHCKIYLEAGSFFAADMESKEGTFVNGEKLFKPKPLLSGDELKIGCVHFKFVVTQT